MTSVYDLLRLRCGLSQQEAADLHGTRLDTVKSWCSGRRQAPDGVIEELQDLYREIAVAGMRLAALVQNQDAKPDEEQIFSFGAPTEETARTFGWKSLGACEAAIGIALTHMPKGMPLEIVANGVLPKPTARTLLRRM